MAALSLRFVLLAIGLQFAVGSSLHAQTDKDAHATAKPGVFSNPDKFKESDRDLVQKLIDAPHSSHEMVLREIDKSKNRTVILSLLLRPVREGRLEFGEGRSGRRVALIAADSPRFVGNPFFKHEVHDVCQHVLTTLPNTELALLAQLELARINHSNDDLCALHKQILRLGNEEKRGVFLFRFWEIAVELGTPEVVCQRVHARDSDYRYLFQCTAITLSYDQEKFLAKEALNRGMGPDSRLLIANGLFQHLWTVEAGESIEDHTLAMQLYRSVAIQAMYEKQYWDAYRILLSPIDSMGAYYFLPVLDVWAWLAGFSKTSSADDVLEEFRFRKAWIMYLRGNANEFFKTVDLDVGYSSDKWPGEIVCDLIENFRAGITTHQDRLLTHFPENWAVYEPIFRAFQLRQSGDLDGAIRLVESAYGQNLREYNSYDPKMHWVGNYLKYVNYQLAVWCVESGDMDRALTIKPKPDFLWTMAGLLRNGENWQLLINLLARGIQRKVIESHQASPLRQRALFNQGKYEEVIEDFFGTHKDLPKARPAELSETGNRIELDAGYAIQSAILLSRLDVVNQLVDLQKNDPRVDDFRIWEYRFHVAVRKGKLEEAKRCLDKAKRESWYEPLEDPLLNQDLISEEDWLKLFGEAGAFQFSMEDFSPKGMSISFVRATKN